MSRSGASSIVRGIHRLLIRSSTHKDQTGRNLFVLCWRRLLRPNHGRWLARDRIIRHGTKRRRLGVHLSWLGDLGGWWEETDFHETRDTGFLLAHLEELWQRVPRYKPLSVGVVLLDLVPAAQHQPDLFATDNQRRQKLSPLVDLINDRYGRCSIGFGLISVRRARV
jgi:hypothetical protein